MVQVYEKEKKAQVAERRKAKSWGRIETASPRETQAQALFAKVTPVIQQTDAQTRVRQMETALQEVGVTLCFCASGIVCLLSFDYSRSMPCCSDNGCLAVCVSVCLLPV